MEERSSVKRRGTIKISVAFIFVGITIDWLAYVRQQAVKNRMCLLEVLVRIVKELLVLRRPLSDCYHFLADLIENQIQPTESPARISVYTGPYYCM